jgi:hypothetical protein
LGGSGIAESDSREDRAILQSQFRGADGFHARIITVFG